MPHVNGKYVVDALKQSPPVKLGAKIGRTVRQTIAKQRDMQGKLIKAPKRPY